ncbi:MAG: thiamine pyrophosphate-dependent enzyme [Gemmataceae bacterium]
MSGFDVVFVAGANFLRLYIYLEPASPIPRSTRIIHLDSHPEEVGKNYPVEVGLIGDPAAGLSALVDCLKDRIDRAAAQGRANRWSEQKKTLQQKLRGQLEEHAADRPMTSWTMMRALADRLPANIAVVEESLTSHGVLEQLAVVRDADALFAHRGWAARLGRGCALGVKLAWPNRPVVALIGDGSAPYGAQALWSAAHHQIPVTFIICKNQQYKILRNCGTVMNLPRLAAVVRAWTSCNRKSITSRWRRRSG